MCKQCHRPCISYVQEAFTSSEDVGAPCLCVCYFILILQLHDAQYRGYHLSSRQQNDYTDCLFIHVSICNFLHKTIIFHRFIFCYLHVSREKVFDFHGSKD